MAPRRPADADSEHFWALAPKWFPGGLIMSIYGRWLQNGCQDAPQMLIMSMSGRWLQNGSQAAFR